MRQVPEGLLRLREAAMMLEAKREALRAEVWCADMPARKKRDVADCIKDRREHVKNSKFMEGKHFKYLYGN